MHPRTLCRDTKMIHHEKKLSKPKNGNSSEKGLGFYKSTLSHVILLTDRGHNRRATSLGSNLFRKSDIHPKPSSKNEPFSHACFLAITSGRLKAHKVRRKNLSWFIVKMVEKKAIKSNPGKGIGKMQPEWQGTILFASSYTHANQSLIFKLKSFNNQTKRF